MKYTSNPTGVFYQISPSSCKFQKKKCRVLKFCVILVINSQGFLTLMLTFYYLQHESWGHRHALILNSTIKCLESEGEVTHWPVLPTMVKSMTGVWDMWRVCPFPSSRVQGQQHQHHSTPSCGLPVGLHITSTAVSIGAHYPSSIAARESIKTDSHFH